MDPNLFAIDSERLLEVLFTLVIFSFLVERSLALPFENRWFVERYASKGIKEPITFGVAFAVCRFWDFDALSVILVKDKTQLWGHVLTAAIVAGGSKASIKLFHEVLGIRSSAEKERHAISEAKIEAAKLAASRPQPQPAAPPQPQGAPNSAPAPTGSL